MCGIAVVHDLTSPAPSSLRWARTCELGGEMLGQLRHRGPDGSGTRQVGSTWLGHPRLAIVDVDGGEQFTDGSGTADVTARQAERLVPEEDWPSDLIAGRPTARTHEELDEQQIVAGVLVGVRAEQVLGRFATA